MGTNYYAVRSEQLENHPEAHLGEEIGIHLTKTSSGWVPTIQYHDGSCICSCRQHPYETWDEFKQYLKRDDIVVRDELGNTVDPDDLIEKLIQKRDTEDRNPAEEGYTENIVGEMNGFPIRKGVWS